MSMRRCVWGTWHVVCSYLMKGCQVPCMEMLHISFPFLSSAMTLPVVFRISLLTPRVCVMPLTMMTSLGAKTSDGKKATTVPEDQQLACDAPPTYANTPKRISFHCQQQYQKPRRYSQFSSNIHQFDTHIPHLRSPLHCNKDPLSLQNHEFPTPAWSSGSRSREDRSRKAPYEGRNSGANPKIQD